LNGNSDVLNFVISLVKTPSLPGQEGKVAKKSTMK